MRRAVMLLAALGVVCVAISAANAQTGQRMSVPDAEARLRAAEQEAGPPARRLIGPLIGLGWAYFRVGREAEGLAQLKRAIDLMDGVR